MKVAVIGYGYWGPNLVRNFSSAKGVEVAYVCDTRPERLELARTQFRVSNVTTDPQEVFSDSSVEAVALATPVATHRVLGEAALSSGKHLWMEKPLAGNVEDAEALVKTAKAHNRTLFVDHTFLFTPAVQKIRDLVQSGELGELYYFDSVRINLGLFQQDTNVLWDLGPHDVSISNYVLGSRPLRVSATGAQHISGAHTSLVYMTVHYPGNLIGHFNLSWLAPVKVRKTMIGGSRKMIVYDDLEPFEKIRVYDKGVAATPQLDQQERSQTLISYRVGDMWSPHLAHKEALASGVEDFIGAIKTGQKPLVSGDDGLAVIRVLSAAQHSLENGSQLVDL